MRILRFLINSLLLLAIIGGAGFFLGRELILEYSLAKFTGDIQQLRDIEREPNDWYKQCYQIGARSFDASPLIDTLQLRFTDDRNYVLEVVCHNFPRDPLPIAKGFLPFWTKKVAGTSGIIWGHNTHTVVELEFLGRRRVVQVDDDVINRERDLSKSIKAGPVTSCVGYGYQCCQETAAVGVGIVVGTATDCPKTCYASCQPRPIVLSFTTDPYLDLRTRSLSVTAGGTVTFSYVIDASQPGGVHGKIDFGDGQMADVAQESSYTEHQFSCHGATPCQYDVSIGVTNSIGVSSARTPTSTIKVIVN